MLVKVCRLSQKHNNLESNIENITLQNDLQITQLKDEIKFKEHQIVELEDINELLLQSKIECYFDGKYNDEIRETIMALVTQFGVSLNKVNGVIQTVVQKITGKTLSRLHSAGVRSRLLVEAKRVAQCQVATAMIDNGPSSELQYGNCLHQDGTSKFHRHFQSFQVTTAEKRTYSIGLTEVGARDTVTLMEAFKTQVEELGSSLKSYETNVAKIARSGVSQSCS